MTVLDSIKRASLAALAAIGIERFVESPQYVAAKRERERQRKPRRRRRFVPVKFKAPSRRTAGTRHHRRQYLPGGGALARTK